MPSSATSSPSSRAIPPLPTQDWNGPVVLALLQVQTPDDWTGLESTLIRLEAVLARQQGLLFRQQAMLTLYFPVSGPTPTTSSQIDATRLQAAFDCVEQLAQALEPQGGRSAVITLGHGPLSPASGLPYWLEAALDQLALAVDPSLCIGEELLEWLPESTRRNYGPSLASLPGFRQRRRPPGISAQQGSHSLKERAGQGLTVCRRWLHSAVHWRPLLLAIPGITMFFLAPYFLQLPTLQKGNRNASPTSSALRREEGSRPELEPAGLTSGPDKAVDQARGQAMGQAGEQPLDQAGEQPVGQGMAQAAEQSLIRGGFADMVPTEAAPTCSADAFGPRALSPVPALEPTSLPVSSPASRPPSQTASGAGGRR